MANCQRCLRPFERLVSLLPAVPFMPFMHAGPEGHGKLPPRWRVCRRCQLIAVGQLLLILTLCVGAAWAGLQGGEGP